MSDTMNWAAISAALRAPFDPSEVDFRVQGKAGASGKAQIVTYIDARCVQDRLDEVVGPGAWSFTWEPVTLANNELHVVKGILTIHGVTREDVGTASNFEPSKGAVSDALKRAAVGFGIGRYLYAIPATWAAVEGNGRIPDATLAQLRAKLPRPDGSQPTAQPRQSAATPPQASTATSTPQRPPAPAQRTAGSPSAAPAAKAATNGHANGPASGPASEWMTTDGCNPLAEVAIRRRLSALGVSNIADIETWLTRIKSDYTQYTRKAIEDVLTEMEARTQAHNLHEAFPAGQRGA